jgi:hypothetical protein
MMKNIYWICIFLLLNANSNSQGINNLWYIGYNNAIPNPNWGGTDLEFQTGVLNVDTHSRPISFSLTNANISDSLGNMLFYSNGVAIANSTDSLMQNGNGLNPSNYNNDPITQYYGVHLMKANIIIPVPDDNQRYYLFHHTVDNSAWYLPFTLYYTVINMTLENGLGAVESKNNILLNGQFCLQGFNSIKHANGRDWWLLQHNDTSNTYLKFLITPFGIDGPFIQKIGKNYDNTTAGRGHANFNLQGTKFAWYDTEGDLDILDFDRCSGMFSNLVHDSIADTAGVGGCAFSPNGQVLYVSSDRYLYQYDLTAANIPASRTTVGVWDGTYSPSPPFAATFYQMQNAPDGKIYIGCGNSTFTLHVINYPDSLGMGCDVCQHCVALPTYHGLGLPNHPNYFLGADTTSLVCDSLHVGLPKSAVKENAVKVFPNPAIANSTVHLQYATLQENALLQLIDINGKVVQQQWLPAWSQMQNIKLNNLSSGIYLLKISNTGYKGTAKVIVQNE